MEENRPNPDLILEQLHATKKDEDIQGKLKIFFGYAAGVGKTYAMLDAAHAAIKAGYDVVAGYIEPHSRPDTIELLKGIPSLLPLTLEYKGMELKELDLDEALKRHPDIMLVDELAHTNATGSRHLKRYQDIEELLQAGIDVYTTVNVQHLESLNDIVASITGVIVRERIPDRIFDDADQIELVDIEPDDLILRLNEGKIYKKNQAQRALSNFFTRDKLVALREIALRRTADSVNRVVEKEKAAAGYHEYYTGEHILTCLSSSASNAKVIRNAARLADAFHGYFTAVYVETKESKEMDEESEKQLNENIKLAQLLGAKIATVYGEDVAYQLAEYAKASGVSKIVIGRTNHKIRFIRTKLNVVEQLTIYAPNIDVYIIPDTQPSIPLKHRYKKSAKQLFKSLNLADTLKSLLILLGCVLLGFLVMKIGLGEANIIMIFILGVVLTAIFTSGRIYGISFSVLCVLIFNFFFTKPVLTFQVYDKGYPLTLGIMLAVSLVTSSLMLRLHMQSRESVVRAYRTEILLENSRKLQHTKGIEDVVLATSKQLLKLLNKTIVFYVVRNGQYLSESKLFLSEKDKKVDPNFYIGEDEKAVAQWTCKSRHRAGISTDTLPGANALYIPVRSHKTVLAVVGIALERDTPLEPFEYSLITSMLNEAAFVLERYERREAEWKNRGNAGLRKKIRAKKNNK